MIVRSLKVPVVVGSVLVAINHGHTVLAANVVDRVDLIWKSPLTCALPNLVSTHTCITTVLASTPD